MSATTTMARAVRARDHGCTAAWWPQRLSLCVVALYVSYTGDGCGHGTGYGVKVLSHGRVLYVSAWL